jgi:arylsulfatase A-like enzyme
MKSALIAALVCSITTLHAQSKPNVIIVITDDQGYGDLSVTGNSVLKTPNMDRLANEGVQFTNFHVDCFCTPTRAALMTGRYAHRVGGWGTVNGRNMLRDDEQTMADVFRHNGYRTGHFGKWHLGANHPYRPIDRGFDESLGKGDGGTGCATDYWNNDRVNDHYIHNGKWEEKPRPGFEGDVFFDAAMDFIRENKARPFFTYLALYNAHNPCSLPDAKVANGFLETISRMDEKFGKLRQCLIDEGLAENTVLVFLTDNGTAGGEKFFNAGMRGKKGSPYDGGHRVPCFLYAPIRGLKMPATLDRLTAHIDLLPTLVDICALDFPKPIKFDGSSLKPLLANPKAAWPERTLVMGAGANKTSANAPPPTFGSNCAVMTERWRLVNDKELYDMTRDPGQSHDIANDNPDMFKQLRAAYQNYWADVSANDKTWRGRPILGSVAAPQVDLCAEEWFTTQGNCPWNQAAIANGAAAFGIWPVRFAEAGTYRIEVRRWPRELNAPIAGVPKLDKTVDAWLDGRPVSGTLYGGKPRALPVSRVELKVAGQVKTTDVGQEDSVNIFSIAVPAGPTDIEATLLDKNGKALCAGYYVSIRKQ